MLCRQQQQQLLLYLFAEFPTRNIFAKKSFSSSTTSASILSPSSSQVSVTRLLNYFKNIWPSTTMKTCPIVYDIFTTQGSIFCQILNKPSKICPRLLRLCQNGEISPNLVTPRHSQFERKRPFRKKESQKCF